MAKAGIQSFRRKETDEFKVAWKYYNMLSTLNEFHLTPRELDLLSFTAVKGGITPMSTRLEFVSKFNSSLATIENIKGDLVKKGLLVKIEGKYRVNPKIAPDFSLPLYLKILFVVDEQDRVSTSG